MCLENSTSILKIKNFAVGILKVPKLTFAIMVLCMILKTKDLTIFIKVLTIFGMEILITEVQIFTQASYGKDYFLLKTAIFPISVFLLLFSMKFHTDLENYQHDSFQ